MREGIVKTQGFHRGSLSYTYTYIRIYTHSAPYLPRYWLYTTLFFRCHDLSCIVQVCVNEKKKSAYIVRCLCWVVYIVVFLSSSWFAVPLVTEQAVRQAFPSTHACNSPTSNRSTPGQDFHRTLERKKKVYFMAAKERFNQQINKALNKPSNQNPC